jgi:hypothetical protein
MAIGTSVRVSSKLLTALEILSMTSTEKPENRQSRTKAVPSLEESDIYN